MMLRDSGRASFNVSSILNDHRSAKHERAALNVARLVIGAPAPCSARDAENAFIHGDCALTIYNLKFLDCVSSPQSEQNVSRFERACVVFSTHSACE
ncbi:hypothetical protein JQ597_27700 [Bradyrhizobium sp. AUGA SZCCT0177]|uniref:hypothetical protein n=1 Tax=unclassified Bradyrhizobium TaxID=2631580 RepID=UPI001BAE0A45|nr:MULTISPECIES: hypothetical protein [unclassified Bradyrhizobium]MBR1234553.1 hypothetical protein [Bradyrhizobium sp. AUGA SZCCT0182]MBR1285841.1 hypothetical protein [Bradyrhizobium sp. AUGA SZCCT0177]